MISESTTQQLDSRRRLHGIKRVLWVVLLLNLVVACAKFFYGLYSQTISMQADGIHSMFDSAGNIVGLIGMAMASRPADYDHPYGHAKFETYASVVIGVLLLFAAYTVGRTAVLNLMEGTTSARVTGASFIVMIGTLVVNLVVTTWEHRESKRLGSEILAADARHTLSDVLVSLGVIASLIFVDLGYELMDPIMSLIVACFILYTAFQVFKQAGATLSDKARIPPVDIARVAEGIARVKDCHCVRTRGSEAEVYVDLHILLDGNTTVTNAHKTANAVSEAVRKAFPQVMDVIVHIEPDTPEERLEGQASPDGDKDEHSAV